jgi:hypothetical protein
MTSERETRANVSGEGTDWTKSERTNDIAGVKKSNKKGIRLD